MAARVSMAGEESNALPRRMPRPTSERLRRACMRWLLRPMLLAFERRCNLFITHGMKFPPERIDAAKFLRAEHWTVATDYARNATLALIGQLLRDRAVPGDLAELGVYKGTFALLMQGYCPERPIHLFDTFEGFDRRDVAVDTGKSYAARFHDFADTSPEGVARRFPDRTRVHLRPGWFPASAAGLEDTRFALVSIDADLYQPVLAGLQWFWPRLSPGGYLLVHDFNNSTFRGAKAAVLEFLAATPDAAICPLPDWGGTAVMAKPGVVSPDRSVV